MHVVGFPSDALLVSRLAADVVSHLQNIMAVPSLDIVRGLPLWSWQRGTVTCLSVYPFGRVSRLAVKKFACNHAWYCQYLVTARSVHFFASCEQGIRCLGLLCFAGLETGDVRPPRVFRLRPHLVSGFGLLVNNIVEEFVW